MFERIAMPEPPAVSPTAGYDLVTPDLVLPSGAVDDGTPRVCDANLGASVADRSSLGGGGHSIGECADTCSNQVRD